MLRITGAFLLILAVGALCLLHTQKEEGRVRQCEGLLLLVRHLSLQIAGYRTPIGIALASFQNEALEEIGFLPLARERGLDEALLACEGRLQMDEETQKCLLALATGLQTPALRDALATCEETEGVLLRALDKYKSEAPARKKTGRVLLVFFGLTVLLLLG